jgi:hypothetical protein
MTVTRDEIHAGDIGTRFEITVLENGAAMDLSTSSSVQFSFRKPDQTIATRTASFITDGTDGKVKYITQEGDLDQKGAWRLQVHVVFTDTRWHSNIQNFTVYENIKLVEESVTISNYKSTITLEEV